MEKLDPVEITFYESKLEVILVPHADPIVIITSISEWWVSLLLVDEGSSLSLLYQNCYKEMRLEDKFIVKDVDKVRS